MDKAQLIAAGFVPTRYEDQKGEFLTKRCRVEDLPYANEHLVDNDFIYGDMVAVTEIIPGGSIQFLVTDADYVEGPVPLDSEEGQALLKDAIAATLR